MPHQDSKPGFLSVTEVLSLSIPKPFLIKWYGSNGTELCEQIKRDSQELGISVHEQIEQRFKGETQSLCSENAQRMVNNFWEKFVGPWEAKPLILEKSYEDAGLKVQGTLDAILDTNKGKYIVDFKTSNTLDKQSVPLQLAAYAMLSGANVWRGLAVRIDKKKDKVEIKEYSDLRSYWPIFLNCLIVAQYVKWGLNEKENV